MASPASGLLLCLLLGRRALALPEVQLHVAPGFSSLRVVEGSDVVLPVWYTKHGEELPDPSWKVLSAMWYLQKRGEKTQQVLAYFSTPETISQPRVSLVHSMPSHNLSLRLQHLQEQDSGSYYCSVNVEGPGNFKSHDSSKMLELTVLIPPAPPSCKLLDVPRVGANVLLSCQSPRSKPAAQYEWTGPSPSTKAFSPRFQDVLRGSLNLTSLSLSMSGVYACKAHNEVGSASCNVTVEVSSVPEPAVVAGAVVGTLLGLGLLVGLVLLFRRRQGKNAEEPANDIKEDAVAPRTLPWSKGSDTVSKNGTLSSVTSARALRSYHRPPRSGALTPSPSLRSQAVSPPILPALAVSSSLLPREDEAQPQQGSLNPRGISSSTLTSMGGVPIMASTQNQAGSLV